MFIIDGHNLLWWAREARQGPESLTELMLVRLLGRYFSHIGQSGQIIFDGAGPSDKTPFDNIEHLEVFFAGFGTDTDAVIEDKIKASTFPRQLIVVSSDRRLRKVAHARKARTVTAKVFWAELQRTLNRPVADQPEEPPAKQFGLSDVETDQWLRFFGLNQQSQSE